MFEDLLTPPARFIVGETYAHRGDPIKFVVLQRSKCYITFITNEGDTHKKKIRYDFDGNEYVEWRNKTGDVYVLGTWHIVEETKK